MRKHIKIVDGSQGTNGPSLLVPLIDALGDWWETTEGDAIDDNL